MEDGAGCCVGREGERTDVHVTINESNFRLQSSILIIVIKLVVQNLHLLHLASSRHRHLSQFRTHITLLTMVAFQIASNTNIHGGTFAPVGGNQISFNRDATGKLDLHNILAPVSGASYTRPEPIARCHPGTRLKVISEIDKWITDGSDRPILWLNAPAGAGKTAIAQTIAEHYAPRIAASFFFLRGAGPRSQIQQLIPTLAYQASEYSPAASESIIGALKNEPDLCHGKSFQNQLQKLLITPIRVTRSFRIKKPIMVIDALDECNDKESMSTFIEAMTAICSNPGFRLPFRLLLTSRVEEHIKKQFNDPVTQSVINYLSLQNFDATDDIKLYMEIELSAIYRVKKHLMMDVLSPWPSSSDIQQLSKNAAGSFMIASTLVGFIKTEKGTPQNKLKIAMNMTDGLDPVYNQVITEALKENRALQQKELQILELVLAVIIILEKPLSIAALGKLLNIKASSIAYALQGLQAILLIPENDHDEPVKLFHTSLKAYLCTKERSRELCINLQQKHVMLAIKCLQKLQDIPVMINDACEDCYTLLKQPENREKELCYYTQWTKVYALSYCYLM
ncbi:hypothetical protein BDQ12DRAFT_666028 [Crucibulum laeve]|uniref:Nephrocystin 3-like N-terminal domain-containing protein n=1 Tax=Crucibulum laeve TaxID=68775 RepID=A0A5C3M1D6_9AGAR|nr:hypothetical protein BDQ12DRAFT_666028 [Crucibulum laeve]